MRQTPQDLDQIPDTGGATTASLLPPPPPSRWKVVQRIWAIVGIVCGFVLCVVPGLLALRSYRRWRRARIRRPLFAWGTACVGFSLFVVVVASVAALYGLPIVRDDFSDPTSGWPEYADADGSVGYADGTYRIGLRGPNVEFTSFVWSEGARPNVAVEADVFVVAGGNATTEAGVGCVTTSQDGYLFVISSDRYEIWALADEQTLLTSGELPPDTRLGDQSHRIRGECRAGYGPSKVAMYVDGTKLAEVASAQAATFDFEAIALAASNFDAAPGEQTDVRFDNAYVIAVQPDSSPPSEP